MNKKTSQNTFKREKSLTKLKDAGKVWDVLVIGGGATGLGVALDSSSRGLKTLLIEQADFANGTSSRSTKLAHGGVRYLAQGNISLVFEALKERGRMIKNAPHLVKMLPFIIPGYSWYQKYFYGIGLKIYDWMARSRRLQKTKILGAQSVRRLLPNLKEEGLQGGILYFDGQFDDTRLAINMAQTASEQGATLINYMKALDLIEDKKGKIAGVKAKDIETDQVFDLQAKTVINATGVFVDDILKMDEIKKNPLVKASQGIHIVLDKSFMDGENALMIPSTSDGRVLFAVPWHDHLLVGTTDTPVETHNLEPVALQSEIDFILETLQGYLKKKPSKNDILSIFAGLRPLVQPDKEKGTKEISRDHKLSISASNLITITGGKWTTYRKMAEDVVDAAIETGNLTRSSCRTQDLKIHGYTTDIQNDALSIYGSDAGHITDLTKNNPKLKERIHPKFPNIKAEIVWAARNEMARNVEDILARRLRMLFLDARAAIDSVETVAGILAVELNKDKTWEKEQIKKFTTMAQRYLAQEYVPKQNKSKKLELK
ncbi:FAD-dependent oxidoreductase [Salegentibacter sp. F14]